MYNCGRFRSQEKGTSRLTALYRDALIAQKLTASTNFFELQSSAGWLGKNASLTGSARQDIAQKSSVRHLLARRIGRNELGMSDLCRT